MDCYGINMINVIFILFVCAQMENVVDCEFIMVNNHHPKERNFILLQSHFRVSLLVCSQGWIKTIDTTVPNNYLQDWECMIFTWSLGYSFYLHSLMHSFSHLSFPLGTQQTIWLVNFPIVHWFIFLFCSVLLPVGGLVKSY